MKSEMSKHKHHIIPRYKCEELGIDPDFPENIVEVTRLDHARIHWGYKCDDLEPLFEYITPAQWIIDLIPRGDNRDSGAAVLTARNEIDGIDLSGENNPMYGKKHSPETRKKIGKNHKDMSGENNPFYGKTHSLETKKKISETNSGRKHTEESKKKISEAMSGENNPFYGKTHTEEVRKKLSETNSGENSHRWNMPPEEHPNYYHGKAAGTKKNPEKRRIYDRELYQKNIERKREIARESYQRNKHKRREKYISLTEEEKEQRRERRREKDRIRGAKNKAETGYTHGYSRAKKKLERQGEGTLENFFK